MPTDKRGLDLLEYAVEIANGAKADRLDAGNLVEVLGGRHTEFPAEDLAEAFSGVVSQAEDDAYARAQDAGVDPSAFTELRFLRQAADTMRESAERNVGDVYAVISSIGGPRDAKPGVCFCRAIEEPLKAALAERDALLGPAAQPEPAPAPEPPAAPQATRPPLRRIVPAPYQKAPAQAPQAGYPAPAAQAPVRMQPPVRRQPQAQSQAQAPASHPAQPRPQAAPAACGVAAAPAQGTLVEEDRSARSQRRVVQLSADPRPEFGLPKDFRGLELTVGDTVFHKGAERTVELIGRGCVAYKNEVGQLILVDSGEVRRVVPDTLEILNQDAALSAERYAFFWGIKSAGGADELLEEDVRRHIMNRALRYGQSLTAEGDE